MVHVSASCLRIGRRRTPSVPRLRPSDCAPAHTSVCAYGSSGLTLVRSCPELRTLVAAPMLLLSIDAVGVNAPRIFL